MPPPLAKPDTLSLTHTQTWKWMKNIIVLAHILVWYSSIPFPLKIYVISCFKLKLVVRPGAETHKLWIVWLAYILFVLLKFTLSKDDVQLSYVIEIWIFLVCKMYYIVVTCDCLYSNSFSFLQLPSLVYQNGVYNYR